MLLLHLLKIPFLIISDLMTTDLMANLFYLTTTPLLCYKSLILFENQGGRLALRLEQLVCITRASTRCLAYENILHT